MILSSPSKTGNNRTWFFKYLVAFYFAFFADNLHTYSQELEKSYIIGNQTISTKDTIDTENFYTKVLESLILDQMNLMLEKKGVDQKSINEILQKAADSQSSYMSDIDAETVIQNDKKLSGTSERITFFGGSRYGQEITAKTPITKGASPYTYARVADDILFRWFSSPKKAELIENSYFNLVGLSVSLDSEHKKVFVSLVLGNYQSLNEGIAYKEQLKIPYTTKTFGLNPPEKELCKKVFRLENLYDLQKGLHTEGSQIYFETENNSQLKKIIRDKKDGLAVDIIQRTQFDCHHPNIIDHNLINKGILTKRIFAPKLMKKNLANTKENSKAFKVLLGTLPEGIQDNYELNLVVIQNKSACVSIPQSFIIPSSGTFTKNIKLLADTVTLNSNFSYKPVADSMEISFKIPFENKKYNYQTSDIEPFLKLLNEPAFIIYDLTITAYSSIEGTDEENQLLQQKRAESISLALKERQSKIIQSKIVTKYNWEDFVADIKLSSSHQLAEMEMHEAQSYIREHKLNKELEPILHNHRYAKIDMKVAYDITGNHEQAFVLKKFQTALSDQDRALALSIQKYIIKQVLSYRYQPNILNEMNIPLEKDFTGLEMNRIWLQQVTNQISNEDFMLKVETLYNLNPDNEYIAFNNIYNKLVQKPFTDLNDARFLQSYIDRLYATSLKKETVDGINLKLQFKLIQFLDSTKADVKLKVAPLEQIKQIIDIRGESLQNSLRLAELFIENRDYLFALETLEPWVNHPNHNETLIYTYLSLCSQFEERMHTQVFENALKRARELNPQRFCELFKGDFFSIRVLENSVAKEWFCKYCQSGE